MHITAPLPDRPTDKRGICNVRRIALPGAHIVGVVAGEQLRHAVEHAISAPVGAHPHLRCTDREARKNLEDDGSHEDANRVTGHR